MRCSALVSFFMCAVTLAYAGISVAQLPSIDVSEARAVFSEAERVSNDEAGKLWGQKLYGSMFFVDPDTRAVVANEPDMTGVLHAQDGVYVGTLPKDVIVSNAPTEWGGKRWTMLILPTIPADPIASQIVLGHEMFHRIQPTLKLMAPDSPNLQLDTLEGRVWLELEWRALASALQVNGTAQVAAIRDALAFRSHRHMMFPGSATTEASLEIAEGVPEFTGFIAGSPDRDSARWRAIGKLTEPDTSMSFVRSFAYTSGPPYGLLLDQRRPGWRTKLSETSDLGLMLAATVKNVVADESVSLHAARYGAAALRVSEVNRAKKAEAAKARYRARLIEGPTLQLPGGNNFAFSFNPGTLVSLDAETVYPTFHATAAWGSLDVVDGVLIPTDFSSATVAAPQDPQGVHIEGPGYTLDLVDGWHVVPGSAAGSYTLKKD